MPTLRTEERTDSEEQVYGVWQKCPQCHRPIMWMTTYRNGRPAPFNPQALCVAELGGLSGPQLAEDGWAPAMYTIGGRKRLCMAPVALRPPGESSPERVMTLHHCLDAA